MYSGYQGIKLIRAVAIKIKYISWLFMRCWQSIIYILRNERTIRIIISSYLTCYWLPSFAFYQVKFLANYFCLYAFWTIHLVQETIRMLHVAKNISFKKHLSNTKKVLKFCFKLFTILPTVLKKILVPWFTSHHTQETSVKSWVKMFPPEKTYGMETYSL